MSFRSDMRRFAVDLKAAVNRGMKHWSVGLWVGYLAEDPDFNDAIPVLAADRPECGCLFGGAILPLSSFDVPSMIAAKYPSFGDFDDDNSPAALISDASERGVDFAAMADFIDGTPDWALDEYGRGLQEDES